MLKIGLIGGGAHSRDNHLPALKHLADENPQRVELTAFCDVSEEVTQGVQAEYHFRSTYTGLAAMLAGERLDGCIAITPWSVTAKVAAQILHAGIPVVIEKPPGRNPVEAKEICDLVAAANGRAMVSVNRRFDPALTAARQWLNGRKIEFIRATMLRSTRTEPDFFIETGLHGLDAMRALMGDIATYRLMSQRVGGALWYHVAIDFVGGASGMLEVIPTCGMIDEIYELFGAGFRARVSVGAIGSGTFSAWSIGEAPVHLEPAAGQAVYVRNGTLAETEAFLISLSNGGPMHPTPHEILQSVEISHQIQAETREP